MHKYDTDFQAFRRYWLQRFTNMDPDDIVCELDIDTDTLCDALWFKIEEYIETKYEEDLYEDEESEDDDEY